MTQEVVDRRAARRSATRDDVVSASWRLAREHGLTGFGLRDVAAEVGMRAPSLYSYFTGKNEIYDAMFADGDAAFLRAAAAITPSRSPRVSLVRMAETFLGFCTEDPVRYQLLFQRVVPGFEPSPASYAGAVEVLDHARASLADIGRRQRWHLDLWTAVTSGLAAQQVSNDPSGHRWTDLVGTTVDMYLAHTEKGTR